MVEGGLEAAHSAVRVRQLPFVGVSPSEHGVAKRVIRGTVLCGFRVVHLPGGMQVRCVALDGLPQDLDRQHRLDPFRTVRRVATYVFRRTADLNSSNPTPMNARPETTGPSSGMPPVLGTGFSEIVSGIAPSLEFTSPAFKRTSAMADAWSIGSRSFRDA